MQDRTLAGLAIGGVTLFVASIVGCAVGQANYHDHIATCTVRDKDRGNSDHGYRVYTEQCGTLSNEDQWFAGKTNSADVQGRLQVGHTYRLRLVGWRNSVMSDFPNIVSVEGEVG